MERTDIECSAFKGSGKYNYTGSLGDIIKESTDVAFSYLKSNLDYFDLNSKMFSDEDFHIHFTEAGSPKDGPSAGCAIVSAILSLLKDKELPNNISMTGEVSLKGEVFKVGGIKEKAIAAKRNNIDTLYVPKDNYDDVMELDNDLKNSINFVFVSNYEEIYKEIFS